MSIVYTGFILGAAYSSSMDKCITIHMGFPGSSDGEESTCNADSIPGLERSPGGEHSNPLQYSCLEDPMDRGAWWATVHGVIKKSDRT